MTITFIVSNYNQFFSSVSSLKRTLVAPLTKFNVLRRLGNPIETVFNSGVPKPGSIDGRNSDSPILSIPVYLKPFCI